MNRSIRRVFFVLWLAAILVICQGCGQMTSTSDTTAGETLSPESGQQTSSETQVGEDGETGDEGQTSGITREAMVFVVDPEYNPIPNAEIGTNGQYSDMNGVFYGEVTTNDAGWVLVKALGYVANYAKPSPFSGEYDLYFVTLAPVQAALYYDSASGSALQTGDEEKFHLEVNLEPGALTEEKGFLELTEINPQEISMDDAWGALENPYETFLSFDISAWNLEGEAVNLGEGKSAIVTIHDADHNVDEMVLKSFDPESGTWIDQEGACTRTDSERVTCVLEHFSLNSYMKEYLNPWQMGTDEAISFKDLYNQIGKLYKDAESQGELSPEDSQTVSDLLNKMAQNALDFAKKNPNESGKAMLMYAAQASMASGVPGGAELGSTLTKAAQDLTAKMAEKLMEKADCGHRDEMMNLAQQGMALGGSAAAAADQLVNTVHDQLDNCVTWKGSIRYTFYLLNVFPEMEDKWLLEDFCSSWIELHKVTIGINPSTGNLDGTSQVSVNFNKASYVSKMGGGDCGPDKHYIDLETQGGGGVTTLTFDGNYDGHTWQIGPMQEGESDPALLYMHMHGLFGCPQQEMEIRNTQIFHYKSQLLHGFFGTPQPPTLEEMLNNGIHRTNWLGMETIRGYQEIYYSSGVNRSPIIPVDQALVDWQFVRGSDTTMDQ